MTVQSNPFEAGSAAVAAGKCVGLLSPELLFFPSGLSRLSSASSIPAFTVGRQLTQSEDAVSRSAGSTPPALRSRLQTSL